MRPGSLSYYRADNNGDPGCVAEFRERHLWVEVTTPTG